MLQRIEFSNSARHFNEPLVYAIKCQYRRFTDRVAKRTKAPPDLSWLIRAPRAYPFLSDSLTLDRLGRFGLEAQLNHAVFYVSPYLWHTAVLPRLNRGLNVVAEQLIREVAAFNPLHPYCESAEQVCRNTLQFINRRYWVSRSQATVSEWFMFIYGVVSDFAVHIGQGPDIYYAKKQRLLKLCLPLVNDAFTALGRLNANRLQELAVFCALRATQLDAWDLDWDIFRQSFFQEMADLADFSESLDVHRYHNAWYQPNDFLDFMDQAPRTVLIELDNCGELLFDLLLTCVWLERGHSVILAVSAEPALIRATCADVHASITALGKPLLDQSLENGQLVIVEKGPAALGPYAYEATADYKKAWLASDCVVIKGESGFRCKPPALKQHGLLIPCHYSKPILYLFWYQSRLLQMAFSRVFRSRNRPTCPNVMAIHHPSSN